MNTTQFKNGFRTKNKSKCGESNVRNVVRTEKVDVKDDLIENSKVCGNETIQTKRNIFCKINVELDLVSAVLFICALSTRLYKLGEPRHIV